MLILTRQLEESILVGDEVEIKVLDIKGKQVRLGIKAPRFIKVDRKECREEQDRCRLKDL